jgi:hypothetical protein
MMVQSAKLVRMVAWIFWSVAVSTDAVASSWQVHMRVSLRVVETGSMPVPHHEDDLGFAQESPADTEELLLTWHDGRENRHNSVISS